MSKMEGVDGQYALMPDISTFVDAFGRRSEPDWNFQEDPIQF